MKLAFVLPRYGEQVFGGAEQLAGSIAEKLALNGHEVEILATCAKDNRTWENYFPEGESIERGLKVKRFKVDSRDLEIWIPKQISIAEGFNLPLEDQLEWLAHSVNSSSMYKYIYESEEEFDYFIFAPYLFGTTFWGALIHPHKSLLIPCLHDETYAYTDVFASMFRQVKACIFNARGEQELAQSLFGEIAGFEVGMGFDIPEFFETSAYYTEKFPYVLCLGRKETGKNAHILIDDFISAKEQYPEIKDLKLVIAGGGSFSDLFRDDALKRDDIVDVSNLSETDKQKLIANSLCLCNPSTNESFSIVIMEAWMQVKPVIVTSKCRVTRDHVIDSNGGLYYQDSLELGQCLLQLLTDEKLAKQLALNGKNYVSEKYNWTAVLKRFEAGVGCCG